MCSEHVIEVNNIQKAFATKKVVRSVSLAVSKGEIFALLGPNVAGKTTLLKMMTTLLRPDSGTITLNGFDTITQSRQVRQQFSVTNQTAAIDQDLSARENLRLFGRLNGLSAKASRTRANELLTDFDLNQSADQTLATFSGGMRRRLDLAVSLVGKPRMLFLDEPTTGLDPRTRTQMWHAIQKLVADGSTVFLTTQYLEEVDQYADQIALIDHGQLIASGTPSELKAQVGGQQLQLTIANQQQVTQAQTICETVLQQPVRVTDQTIIGPLVHDDMGVITAILNQCQLAGITISDLQLTAPSLDDVFLKMTVGKN
ncbi:ATP-binding cassette domain-containing protein [Latilactobacillus curvatus]|uniref:ATP-binding cassette domain-containing protein n=1 Tax=Latilactobacillus curvatus TaxID=28038 RepID=A0A385ADV9_LATCU|nr:ATP-binding cassette domain-containing protein [Latilactobacillus curvatus]AXN35855.1 ATP-binding cassette domain-containing protein [Latilactobacillus curvatus]MCM6843626.1 ATP-binding cassette domain-containing protein [Latilactobacillus curvatus]MCM6861489.1 ATP-binding cassette domain-containing protein [Latilactobacillus curvatus]MCM6868788.1 ATP-binding cassette domain-containing protein [Latilactobacillus curvatus]MCT1215731.1 ATP-binding cassette domain-containing protein [Latilacto